MPSLSFDETKTSKPIAIVKGGDYDGEVLYLHDDEMKKSRRPKREVDAVRYDKDLKHLKPAQRVATINRIQEAIARGIPADHLVGESEEIKRLYHRIQSDQTKDTSVVLPDDSAFQLIPPSDPKQRSVWYIAGASGSGKSYIARQLAEAYKKMFPSREIYLISKLNEDSTLDTMKIGKPKRIRVATLVEDYPSIDEFKDCMIIFDDYDTFQGAEGKAVQTLIDDLAIQGRHTGTTILCLTHYITNYKKTRLLLNEATHFVIYPQATSYHALKYLLTTHIGMDAEEVKRLRKLGRWICVSKNFPQYLISQHTAKILHQE
jgi:hypothetical protein